MKKLLLLGLGLISFQAYSQTQRRVLVEEFTNASCGPCASQNPAFNALLGNNMDKIVQIKYQTSKPGTDPMNAHNPSEVAARATRYGVSGVPQAVIDGDSNKPSGSPYVGAPANLTQAGINAQYAIPAPFSLNATYSYNQATDTITSVVTLTNMTPSTFNSVAAGTLRLYWSLVEMEIKFANPPGTNGEKEFIYVMRKMHPDANGQALPDAINANQTLTYTIKIKKPSYIYKPEQMAAVAWIQDNSSNAVHQSTLALPPGAYDASLTNSSTENTLNVCQPTLNPSITITNKGATPITSGSYGYTVNGAAGVTLPWTGNLAPGASTTVTMTPINGTSGINIYQFFFNNINGGVGVDYNIANNQMNKSWLATVGAISTGAAFVEDFESTNVGKRFTSQSISKTLIYPQSVVNKSINSSISQEIGAYAASNKSYRFQMFLIEQGDPQLIFYKNNVSSGVKTVDFDYAYNHYSGSDGIYYDTMSVAVSKDCGATWTEIWRKGYEDLRTTTKAPLSTDYFPAGADWKFEFAEIPTDYQNSSELIVKFTGHSGWGNNAYIDNIRFSSVASVNEVTEFPISIYPIPANDLMTINANVNINNQTHITMTDAMGKVVYSNTLNVGVVNEQIATSSLAEGVYLVRITNGNATSTKTISVKH